MIAKFSPKTKYFFSLGLQLASALAVVNTFPSFMYYHTFGWTVAFMVSALIFIISVPLTRYCKTKAQQDYKIKTSEVLEQGTKYIFEEGEDDDQEK